MRKPFIAANWKMNHTLESSCQFLQELPKQLGKIPSTNIDIAICVPYIYIIPITQKLVSVNQENGYNVKIGAQNMHWEAKGAFTGEVSGPMLSDIACTYIILGHSERRTLFGETDEKVSKKAKAAFASGLMPIICVGETLAQRDSNETMGVIQSQLLGSLASLTPAQVEVSTIAYEPVWAIGTGRAATPAMAQEVHKMIREYIAKHYGESISQNIRIQYGGSVTPENALDLMAQPDIDGALIGGASLKADSLSKIIQATLAKKNLL
ncbi:MAG: triose-phosphate isomerase [Candidatus Brocadiae bacterium]|nr:triose-phosphate isomerase [Candidatus Brocadiia bacterium]